MYRVGLRVQSKLQSKYHCSDGSQREDHVNHNETKDGESYLDNESDAKKTFEEDQNYEEVMIF